MYVSCIRQANIKNSINTSFDVKIHSAVPQTERNAQLQHLATNVLSNEARAAAVQERWSRSVDHLHPSRIGRQAPIRRHTIHAWCWRVWDRRQEEPAGDCSAFFTISPSFILSAIIYL